jgi:hypothetical protein
VLASGGIFANNAEKIVSTTGAAYVSAEPTFVSSPLVSSQPVYVIFFIVFLFVFY